LDSSHNTEHGAHSQGDTGPGYELRDVQFRGLLWFAGIVTVVLVLVFWLMSVFVGALPKEKTPGIPAQLPTVAPGIEIYDVLHNLRESEKTTLNSYGWVDREAGVVRIPIDRALDLAAQRGVPEGKKPLSEEELNSHSGLRAEEADAQPKAADPDRNEKDLKK